MISPEVPNAKEGFAMGKDPMGGLWPTIGPTELSFAEKPTGEAANSLESMGEPQLRVELCKKKLGKVEIYIEAYIDPVCGALIIHGLDTGPVVEEYLGKSDYEYWRIVPCQEKGAVLAALQGMTRPVRLKQLATMGDQGDWLLVQLVKEHFSSDAAISCFEEWCNARGIVYTCQSL